MATSGSSIESTPGLPGELDLPVLAIRNTVIFPVLAFPINVGRDKSLQAVEKALAKDKLLGILSQKEPENEDPSPGDLYATGTVVKVLKSVKMPGNKLNVIIQGLARIKVRRWHHTEPYLRIEADVFEEPTEHDASLDSLLADLRELSQKIIDLSPQIPSEAGFLVRSIDNPGILADIVSSNLSIDVEEKQDLLETFDTRERIEKVIDLLNKEIQVLELSNKIQTEVKGEMDKAQREYFLREQLKAIQKELGDTDERQEEFEELERKIRGAEMPSDVEKVAFKELKRMSRMNPGAAEYTVARTYVDWLIDIPWSKSTEDHHDLKRAEVILDEDHYDLEEVKKRIVEYLAVRKLKEDMKGPILCLVGPPGVGKTSLATSVARALDRKMVRISLGGVHDEAEIRGHRRTYIGSLPGKIIKGMKKAGTNNPVFVLDEIDKLGRDHRGDPASALLEVLDPEQNHSFTDHYLDVPFDLSRVLFIATGNWPDSIPGPLYDRMEVLYVSGYTVMDKLRIAFDYLIPQVLDDHGMTAEHLEFTEDAVKHIISAYTREPGVRALKREIAACMRAIAKAVASDEQEGKAVLTPERIEEIRGPIKHFHEIAQRTAVPGVATGLSWTAAGGDILFIEATRFKGKGALHLSGKLGDVMKESVSVARSYVRAMATDLGVDEDIFETNDIHIHVPAGAVGKDGPSAGIAIVTAITSLLTGIPVDPTLGMTGEVTLRGAVMPIGGVKEKIVAAHRAGIQTVILPEWNRKDVHHEVPDEVKDEMNFHFCARVEEVLELALGMTGLANKTHQPERPPAKDELAEKTTPAEA